MLWMFPCVWIFPVWMLEFVNKQIIYINTCTKHDTHNTSKDKLGQTTHARYAIKYNESGPCDTTLQCFVRVSVPPKLNNPSSSDTHEPIARGPLTLNNPFSHPLARENPFSHPLARENNIHPCITQARIQDCRELRPCVCTTPSLSPTWPQIRQGTTLLSSLANGVSSYAARP